MSRTRAAQSTVDVVGAITGLDINQSVVINLRGFRALVDAMGGVDVNVQQRVCVECHTSSGGIAFTTDKSEYIEPGLRHLDGKHALWYARSRAGSDDFSRMRRQRCVAGALMQQADPVGLLQSYPQLAKVVKNNVSIDIPRDELSAWVDLALRIQKGGSIRSLPLTADVVRPGNPDFAKIRTLVQEGPAGAGGRPSTRPRPPPPPRPRRSRPSDHADRHARRLAGRVARRHLLRPRLGRPGCRLECSRHTDAVRPPPAGHLHSTGVSPARGGPWDRRRGPAGDGTASCVISPRQRDLSGIDSTLAGLLRRSPNHRPSLEESPAWS